MSQVAIAIDPTEPQSSSQLSATRKRQQTQVENESNTNSSSDGSSPPTTTACFEPQNKIAKTNDDKQQNALVMNNAKTSKRPSGTKNKARETRLEQNRKAARESRRRKKVMIEELQRSVIFFSRANGTLKHQNDELTRLLIQAQAQVSVIESNKADQQVHQTQQQQQQRQTIVSSKGESMPQSTTNVMNPSFANTAIAVPHQKALVADPSNGVQTSTTTPAPSLLGAAYPSFPVMQPGATMQAMANFQQAASAAMQAAVQNMQGIPGVTLNSLAPSAPNAGSVNAHQAYNDTMTALAMQQAAVAAAASGQFFPPSQHFMQMVAPGVAPTPTQVAPQIHPKTVASSRAPVITVQPQANEHAAASVSAAL